MLCGSAVSLITVCGLSWDVAFLPVNYPCSVNRDNSLVVAEKMKPMAEIGIHNIVITPHRWRTQQNHTLPQLNSEVCMKSSKTKHLFRFEPKYATEIVGPLLDM